MKVANLELCLNSKTRTFIEMEEYAGPLKVRFPLLIACGKKKLPMVTLTAALHGREVQGIEVIRRVFESLDAEKMNGTVLAIPVANPLSVRMWQQDYPSELGRETGGEGSNLNRNWPGRQDGTLHEQMCYALWETAIRHSSFHIDLHGCSDNSMELALGCERDREGLNLFSLPITMVRPLITETEHKGRMSDACETVGIPQITAELTPQNRLREESVQHGVRGVSNILKHLGIIDGPIELEEKRYFITPKSVEHCFTAGAYGLVSPEFPIGTMLAKGQRFGALHCLDTLEPIQELIAPEDGLLFNIACQVSGQQSASIAAPGMNIALVKEISEVL